MAKRRAPTPKLKTVREWLFDYFATIEGTKMDEILADVAKREVESFKIAREHVNLRIDNWISWLNGIRPMPCPAEEPEAFARHLEARKAKS